MKFKILNGWGDYPSDTKNAVFLTWDNWNDYSFFTLFGIFYVDYNSHRHDLGSLNIGFYGQKEGDRVMEVGTNFDYIGDEYFSVGTSEQYYAALICCILTPGMRFYEV
ncbi:MAG: hypothetical protein EOO04_39020 [Chitinophagaceae bacterium]|nr:MAG: hypothetical protein EOO04_39020 [Chitinophagaceae bacterium]